MVGDVFEIYYKEHVQKMKGSDDDIKKVEDKYLYDLCELLIKYCEEVRAANILTQVAQQCVSAGFQEYNALIAGHIGDLHSKNLLNSKAYTYYLRANNLPKAIESIKKVMRSGYEGE